MWIVETLNDIVDVEIEELPKDLRARLSHVASLIEGFGFDRLPRDTIKHLEDKLWEIRLKGKSGISRAIYVTAAGKRVVIVRVFVKKTQKTPLRELEIARKRAREII